MSDITGSSWHSYPKILAVGHAGLADLFKDESVLIQEKIDGSQFSFGKFGDTIKVRSKGREFTLDTPDKMFNQACLSVEAIASQLHDGWAYRGEYLQKPKHNALAYDRIPVNNIIIFDITIGHEEYLPYEQVCIEAERLGFEVVPKFTCDKMNAEKFTALLETTSILGGQKIEGIVVKNYTRFGRDGKVLMGKFVSERFKEIHGVKWKSTNPTNKDVIGLLSEQYRHETRWDKAIQHLRERGDLDSSPKDIGKLILEVKADIQAECEEEIKQALWEHAKSHILRASTRGLAEWYKEKLLENQAF